MDSDGVWQPPERWPEDTPPIDGWVRRDDGTWEPGGSLSAPLSSSTQQIKARSVDTVPDKEPIRRSRQAEADRRAILSVLGALVAAAVLLVAALIVINQADASPEAIESPRPAGQPEVIFQAETDAALAQRRLSAAQQAPADAVGQLIDLSVRNGETELAPFDSSMWVPEANGCLDSYEEALIERSTVQVTFADGDECELLGGLWIDRYLDADLQSVDEVEVQTLVPPEQAHVSGGSDWTAETRQAFLTDLAHPATLHVVARGTGHNPRGEAPDAWRPSSRSAWCAYAVDWIATKTRWELSVTPAEQIALSEMLETCGEADSAGADLRSVVIFPVPDPVITLVG